MLAAAGTASAAALEPGTLAPDIALPQANLPIGRLSDLRGRVVYLDFWASWCGPCRLSFPWMARLQANHQARGLQVLALNLDERRADADAFLARTPAAFGVAFDASGEGAKRFGVKGMPSSALIDANGRLLWQHRGFRLDEAPELERRIVEALPRQ
ncbi:TlpA family protein disulfide reductase [Inhella sp. 4Y17]|uniref:TlpA family protein disulfide reductase n=1 Tax=Inhella gelatinilytica TaxID=2795030 RepID=A0A931IVG7_9BURK|nr:TlpA family protein disulfide reductase [Inhella gelatinilytica]